MHPALLTLCLVGLALVSAPIVWLVIEAVRWGRDKDDEQNMGGE